MKSIRKSDLSPHRRRFLELLQSVNFGWLTDIVFVDGEPCFDPPPRVTRLIKFSGQNGPRPELKTTDFALKDEHLQLFRLIDELRNGAISRLDLRHGLPVLASVEVRADADDREHSRPRKRRE